MGSVAQASIDALDAARKQRNVDLYDDAGTVEDSDVDALVQRVVAFEREVRSWMRAHHPELLGGRTE